MTAPGDPDNAGRAARARRARRARRVLAGGQLPLGRPDLPARQPAAAEPLEAEHVKPRLLGHFGTTPGLNLDLRAPQPCDPRARPRRRSTSPVPATAAPALVANAYLEGTYTELYPHITARRSGLQALFRQFSFPGGIPSHVAPETPGSIHEGGELGYALSHAFGAAFDNPDLLVACVVGDGEAETGPLATSWHSNKFLDPPRDGAVLPILHLNGYKIANPTVLARIPEHELVALFEGYGWRRSSSTRSTSRRPTCTSASPRRSTRRSTRSAPSRTRPRATPAATRGRAGR